MYEIVIKIAYETKLKRSSYILLADFFTEIMRGKKETAVNHQ